LTLYITPGHKPLSGALGTAVDTDMVVFLQRTAEQGGDLRSISQDEQLLSTMHNLPRLYVSDALLRSAVASCCGKACIAQQELLPAAQQADSHGSDVGGPNAVGGAAEKQSVAVIQLAAEARPTPARSKTRHWRTLSAIVVDGKRNCLPNGCQ
jgi:hypothetical protein